jgi:hypothetical protein
MAWFHSRPAPCEESAFYGSKAFQRPADRVKIAIARIGARVWQRTVIDDSLSDGHTVAVELGGGGCHEIVVGQRGGTRSVYGYTADIGGNFWSRRTLDHGEMAAGCATADFNSEGRPDVVCIGNATANLKWYETSGRSSRALGRSDLRARGAAGGGRTAAEQEGILEKSQTPCKSDSMVGAPGGRTSSAAAEHDANFALKNVRGLREACASREDHSIVFELGAAADWEHGGSGSQRRDVRVRDHANRTLARTGDRPRRRSPQMAPSKMPFDALFKKPWQFTPTF